MNVSPMRLRFVSGFTTSASCSRKRSVASTWRSLIAMCFVNVSTTLGLAHPQKRCRRRGQLVAHRAMNGAAATAESTPPESAQITAVADGFRIASTDFDEAAGGPSPLQLATSKRGCTSVSPWGCARLRITGSRSAAPSVMTAGALSDCAMP
jgi:hypothetical protein